MSAFEKIYDYNNVGIRLGKEYHFYVTKAS